MSFLQKHSFNFGVKELLKILLYFFQKHRILAKFIGTPPPHFLLLPSMLNSKQALSQQFNIQHQVRKGRTEGGVAKLWQGNRPFWVIHFSLYFKVSLSVTSLLWISVFIHCKSRANYHGKNFGTLRLTLVKRLSRTLEKVYSWSSV